MPDKKLTDSEKVLDIIDLINRLQEEKQILKYDYDNLKRQFDEIYQQFHYLSNVEIPYLYSFTEDKDKKLETIANILLRTKAEAYKEFADRLKEDIVKALNTALGMEHISIYCANIKSEVQTIYEWFSKEIDILLKELVGDSKAE